MDLGPAELVILLAVPRVFVRPVEGVVLLALPLTER